jgi:hypothetical protein
MPILLSTILFIKRRKIPINNNKMIKFQKFCKLHAAVVNSMVNPVKQKHLSALDVNQIGDF